MSWSQSLLHDGATLRTVGRVKTQLIERAVRTFDLEVPMCGHNWFEFMTELENSRT